MAKSRILWRPVRAIIGTNANCIQAERPLPALPNFPVILKGWSPNADNARGTGGSGSTAAHNRWTLFASLAGHSLLLLALGILTSVQPIETPPLQSIDVQIVSEPQNAAVPQAPTASPVQVGAAKPTTDATSLPPIAAPTTAPATPREEAPSDGMSHPTHLLAEAYIREPASAEIRKNMPRLAPSERVTQMCNIEAGQQIQAANPKILVDTVHASALADTTVDGLTITAPQAAYRSKKQWYAVSFVCTVSADFKGVIDFKFKVGDAVPRNLWDAHYLNSADENE